MDEVENQGQVQQDSQESVETVAETTDKPGQASEEQPETTEDEQGEAKPQVFTDRFGNELTAEQLYEKYMGTAKYITQLEAEKKQWEQSAQKEASQAVSENEYLKNVDPDVKEAIVQIVTPVIQDSLRQRDAAAQKKAQDEAFSQKLNALKDKYPGGNGLPKFEEAAVLQAMRDPDNTIFDPEWKFKEMNFDKFVDFEIKQAMKGKGSGVKTESTTGTQPKKPERATPKTWEDAARAAMSR